MRTPLLSQQPAAFPIRVILWAFLALVATRLAATAAEARLTLNEKGYFETRGFNVLVFNHRYDGSFNDAKIAGIELIHHGVRTATNGDVRLAATPAQWDPVPELIERRVNPTDGSIEAHLRFPNPAFEFVIRAEARGDGIVLSVNLTQPLPPELEGAAGFNLEFLPAAYFQRTFLADGVSGNLPLYPTGPMTKVPAGALLPGPLATGSTLVLAPEDPGRRVTITSPTGSLSLYDGRNLAQSGWFVVRTLIPGGKAGRVVEWTLTANTIPRWTRPPVIGHSQAGYHPKQIKHAVVELDANDTPAATARVLQVQTDGTVVEKLSVRTREWGPYLRYRYLTFDFTAVDAEGLYELEYAGVRTAAFRIAADAYANTWHPTNDVYLPIAMDHMTVNEADRVWHGNPHRDDALQAPVRHEHFDLYAQGPTTDTAFKPGEHIGGLNVGGWMGAGDFELRTQANYAVVQSLVHTWETFAPKRDQVSVDQKNHVVDIHVPDGVPDILQQIEHGTLQLLAQHQAVGHAIHGIVAPDLVEYTHLGDPASKTDGLIYSRKLKPGESDGVRSGTFDDRWAFTSKASALNYGSAAGLAAASRALRGYRDSLAEDCLATAKHVWDEEHSHAPDLFQHGNTTGGLLPDEEFDAAVELVLATTDARYAQRAEELWAAIEHRFALNAVNIVRLLPFASAAYHTQVRARVEAYRGEIETLRQLNPYGVPISTDDRAGNARVVRFATTVYVLHQAFPELIDAATTVRGLEYLFGCHPASDVSFVSGVGTVSKEVSHSDNRADITFIAGSVYAGVLIHQPDYPENQEDGPFLWGENAYDVNLGARYLFLVHAANELMHR